MRLSVNAQALDSTGTETCRIVASVQWKQVRWPAAAFAYVEYSHADDQMENAASRAVIARIAARPTK